MGIPISIPRVKWSRFERKKLFYLDRTSWEYVFDDTKGNLGLNAAQVIDIVKDAKKSIKNKKDTDIGPNVIYEIRDYNPVQQKKAQAFLRLIAHSFQLNWKVDEHIHACVFWMPALKEKLKAKSLDATKVAEACSLSVKAVKSLTNHYRASIEVARVVAEFALDGDPDDHICTDTPQSPRSPRPEEGKIDIQRNPGYVLSMYDLDVVPRKAAGWSET